MSAAFDFDAIHARAVAKREAAGLCVHFINERGQPDRYAFADPVRAERFRERLASLGREILAADDPRRLAA